MRNCSRKWLIHYYAHWVLPGNYYVDSIGGNPYEPRPKRVAKERAKDYDDMVSTINALILRRNHG
jgi:hypothetical protein